MTGTRTVVDTQRISVRHLTKRYGRTLAVDDLSFDVTPGMVTGFLGPNGSGKTTTLRLILGVDTPTAGSAMIGGRAYRDLPAPLREVGALIDASAVHPGRRADDYLLGLARSNDLPAARASEVLDLVGLGAAGRRRVGGFSLGMRQRLGIAAAMLGDLTAVPRRGRLMASKAIVNVALTLVVGEIITFIAFFVGQALISGHAPTAAIGQAGVLRALIGCGLYGAMIGLFGYFLGVLVRQATAAIVIVAAVLYVLPGIASTLPSSVEHGVEKFWPTQAGQQLTVVVRGSHTLSPWAGFGVFCAFVAVLAIAATIRINHTDA